MNIAPLKREIDQIAKDKGIDKRTIISALEEAMKQAARRKFGLEKEIEARFNPETSEIELFEFREVVETITDRDAHITLENAKTLDPEAEVVVTDGFTGNVSLKLMEGTAKAVTGAIRGAARSNPLAALGGLLMRPALGGLRRELAPDTTGGAILLGLNGVAVVGHGSSGAEGIANAVRLAARCVEVDAVGRTAALMREAGAGRAALATAREGEARA